MLKQNNRKAVKILVAGDDWRIIHTIRVSFSLRWPNAEVIVARDEDSAVKMVGAERPDVIIIDNAMADTDGNVLRSRIQDVSRAPVLMLISRDDTGVGPEEDIPDSDDQVIKPFTHSELVSKAMKAWTRMVPDTSQPTSNMRNPQIADGNVDDQTGNQERPPRHEQTSFDDEQSVKEVALAAMADGSRTAYEMAKVGSSAVFRATGTVAGFLAERIPPLSRAGASLVAQATSSASVAVVARVKAPSRSRPTWNMPSPKPPRLGRFNWTKLIFYLPLLTIAAGLAYHNYLAGMPWITTLFNGLIFLVVGVFLVELGFRLNNQLSIRHTQSLEAEQRLMLVLDETRQLLTSTPEPRTVLEKSLSMLPLSDDLSCLLAVSAAAGKTYKVVATRGPNKVALADKIIDQDILESILRDAEAGVEGSDERVAYLDASSFSRSVGKYIPPLSDDAFMLIFPLLAGDQSYGLLVVSSPIDPQMPQSTLKMLAVYTQQVAGAIARRGLSESLHRTEKDWQGVLDVMDGGACVIGPDKQVIKVNDGFARLLGYDSKQSIIGKRCYEAMRDCPIPISECQASLATCPAPPERHATVGDHQLLLRHHQLDGNAGGAGIVHTVQDVTELYTAYEDIESRNQEIETLDAIMSKAGESASLKRTLNGVLYELIRLTQCEGGWICLSATGEDPKIMVTSGLTDAAVRDLEDGRLVDVSTRFRVRGEAQVRIDSLGGQTSKLFNLGREPETLTATVLALRARDMLLGSLGLVNHDGSLAGSREKMGLVMIARCLSLALENAILFDRACNEAQRWGWLKQIGERMSSVFTVGSMEEMLANALGGQPTDFVPLINNPDATLGQPQLVGVASARPTPGNGSSSRSADKHPR